MGRAISFFFISVVSFVIALLLARDTLSAGIFAITLAFIYVVFPVYQRRLCHLSSSFLWARFMLRLVSWVWELFLTICILEFALPTSWDTFSSSKRFNVRSRHFHYPDNRFYYSVVHASKTAMETNHGHMGGV
jgi:hypothetical protein